MGKRWVTMTAKNFRWDSEDHPTKEAAETALRAFWKGTPGIRFNMYWFTEIEVPDTS